MSRHDICAQWCVIETIQVVRSLKIYRSAEMKECELTRLFADSKANTDNRCPKSDSQSRDKRNVFDTSSIKRFLFFTLPDSPLLIQLLY